MYIVVAAFGGLLFLFWFAREEPIIRTFPVNFCFQRSDRLAVVIPNRPFPEEPLVFVAQVYRQNNAVLNENPDRGGQLVYHELLQKTLVDWIALYHSGNWRMESLRFDGLGQKYYSPETGASEKSSLILSVGQVQARFVGNRFSGVHSGSGTLALPIGTELQIDPPTSSEFQRGTIRLKNRYCEILLHTESAAGFPGLGNYSQFVGFHNEYWTQQYIVRATIRFKTLFIGHREMASIRRWAAGIVDGLQSDYDEQTIWRKALENYNLSRQLPPTPISTSAIGPMQIQEPRLLDKRFS